MQTNNLEITIKAPVEKAWAALTDSAQIGEWMENVEVETHWHVGSPIKYTCYDEQGQIMKWEGNDMVWDGIIEVFQPDRELTCEYPSKSTGLERESYFSPAHSAHLKSISRSTSSKVPHGKIRMG